MRFFSYIFLILTASPMVTAAQIRGASSSNERILAEIDDLRNRSVGSFAKRGALTTDHYRITIEEDPEDDASDTYYPKGIDTDPPQGILDIQTNITEHDTNDLGTSSDYKPTNNLPNKGEKITGKDGKPNNLDSKKSGKMEKKLHVEDGKDDKKLNKSNGMPKGLKLRQR
jgi:hypothetical protein